MLYVLQINHKSMNVKILFNEKALNALFAGVSEVTEAVGSTLGPFGRNVIIDKGYGIPHVTKDGVTVARAYDTDDPVKRIGATMVKIAAARTCDEAGDGTTTATLLTEGILRNAIGMGVEKLNIREFRKGMMTALKFAEGEVTQAARPIAGDDVDAVKSVALVSTNGDEEAAAAVAEALFRVGDYGVITVEEGRDDGITVSVTNGFKWAKGLTNAYFVTDSDRMECVLAHPYILLSNEPLRYIQEILPIVQTVYSEKRSLLIVAPDMSADVMQFVVANVRQQNGLLACFVKAPGYGSIQKELLSDLAVRTGGTVVGQDTGYALNQLDMGMLGEADKAVVNVNTTNIIGGRGTDEEVTALVQSIKAQMEAADSTYDREKLQERLANITGGAAVIAVGGHSEVEVAERKDRVDDAVAAVRAAVADGVVPGGGVIQLRVYGHLRRELNDGWNASFMAGYRSVMEAVMSILEQLAVNACVEPDEAVMSMYDIDKGLNYETMKPDEAVIDPAKVFKTALTNAVSVTLQFLTTACVMAIEPEKKQ